MTNRLKTTPLTWSLLTALLLAGCAQHSAAPAPTPAAHAPTTPSTTAQPAKPVLTAGRTYELQFKRDGQGKLVSSVITPGQLGAQATRMTDAPLAFSYVSSGTLNMNGQWYVRVTYHVTNHSGQPISNLGFVPLDTDAAPSATPATTPTVGATYFKDLKHFDGSDASGQAASLVAIQARDASGAVDSAATPYVPINTSGLGVNLPTGLVLGTGGLSGSGWQTGSTLAPGASSDVTFATQMPAVSGTTDPFFYTVVFTAVSNIDVPVAIAPQAGANPNVKLPASGPAYVTGTIGDPTDPASVQGLNFTVAASDTDAAGLNVTATSSDSSVATVSLSGSGANRTLKIAPQKAGYADITVTVADGTRASASYTVKYAASQAAGATASTRFFSNESNASSAQDLGGYMLVADDEFNTLNLYPTTTSSAPLAKFDFTSSLNLTDTANPEIDLEASARLGNRIFWLGSESNSKKGAVRTNRNRVFATDVSGSGAATTLSYVGRYDRLREDLLAWDHANGAALGLNTSAAPGVIPELDGVGYNIEGLAFKPGTTTAYISFRAPLETTSSRNLALIVPVTNFVDLVTGAASSATFDPPIQLDLGGRAIRELKCNGQGCLILAGPATSGSNFALYSWSGKAGDAPHLRNDLQSLATSMDGSLESIVNMPAVNPDSEALTGQTLQLLTDNGDSVFYGDGIVAKDLVGPAQDWQKFRAETVTVGALPAQSCTVSNLTITPASPTLTVGSTQTFTASYTTTPSNCTVSVTWSSSNSSVLSLTSAGQATAVAAGSATITAGVTPGSGAPVSATTTATVNAPTSPVTSLPNVSVYRVGDGGAALANTGNAVFVETYNGNDGSLVSSVALPTAASGSNKPLIASGTATSEGLLSRSADGHFLVLTGYGTTAPYSASLSGTKSSAVPRTIGRIDAQGNVDTTTSLTDAVSGNNPRSVASANGSSFYIAGGAGGVNYAPLGATTSTNILATPANLRQLNIYGGQLYASSSVTGTKGVLSIGSGLPSTPGQTAARLPGLSDTLSADSYSYYLADLDGTPGLDTLYVADGTAANGLEKFSLQSGSWVTSGAASGKYVGLTGAQQGNSVTLFATNAAGTQLVKLTDASGYLGSLSGAPTVLTTAKTNTALRGVALAPTP
ncbi:DUF3616 domain-containing protein [Deinococcus sp.]|uniref:DUF3616 domain-containing protein n=1 Tax=Deinococcus sp. TaxID=47478 RepID=UPI0025B976D4|nr:DUF3616 domain-containing protein [Deinococcus sp.]